MRRLVLLGALLALTATWALGAPVARAACHAFEVAVAPSSPTEGGTVEVTVRRDAAVNPSSVRVRSADGSASAGQDYDPVDQVVRFTTETEATFSVRTTQDSADEPDETFRLELSDGGGCQINPNFRYGAPATITIQDDDEAAPTTTATAAPTTSTSAAVGSTTTTNGAPIGSTTTTDADATTTTSLRAAPAADDDDDDGGSSAAWLVVAAVVIAAAAAGGYWFRRARRGRPG